MLVGFAGASGSGKTTLVNECARRLKKLGYNVGVVNEVVREVFKEFQEAYGFNSLMEIRNSDMLLEFQKSCLIRQILKEDEAVRKHDIVLTDRTVYDNIFYTLFWQKGDIEGMKEYITLSDVVRMRDRYDLIFLCEPIDDNVDDGFRTVDVTYREVQHAIISMILPKFIYVPAWKGLNGRVDFVLNKILEVIE